MRLYSTASEGDFCLNRLIGCCWRHAAETVAFRWTSGINFLLRNVVFCFG
ncbi:MAG: hypothetical protein LBP59_12940 [Planctomycetaceae bacterium]|nr:hypothetical protein [Planctomycetaceae bacterium]